MSKFITLTKILIKAGNDSVFKNSKKSRAKNIIKWLLLAACFAPMAVLFGLFIAETYDILVGIQQEALILGFGLSVVSFVIFFFGIMFIMSVFYFSMDIENLLPLPLKPSQILGAKFVTVLIYEYYTEIILFLPVIIAYGIKSRGGILYYIYSIVVFLILPVIPLIAAAIIDMIIMRFTNLAKNKDRFKVVGGAIAMFFGVGVNLALQKLGNTTDQQQLVKMFTEGKNSFVGLSTKIFPSSKLAVYSLVNSGNTKGVINLILFLVISIILVIIFILLGEKVYFKGVIGISETVSKRKKLTSKELEKNLSKNSPIKSHTLKELKILFRTPAYFLNCVLMNFLWPVFFLIPMVFQEGGFENFNKLGSYLEPNKGYVTIVLVGMFAFFIFLAAANPIASTAISREGKKLFVLKYLPVSYTTQLMAKVLSGVIMSSLGMIVMLSALTMLFNPPVYLVVMTGILGIIGIIFSNFTGILIDLNSPKLKWDSEQKAVKQNKNVMIHTLLCIMAAGATVFIIIKLGLSLNITFMTLLIIYSIIDIGLYYALITKGLGMLKEMQA